MRRTETAQDLSAGLERHTVLVTGSSRGLGRAIAIDLAQRGAAVCFHGQTEQAEIEAAIQSLRAQGHRAIFYPFDVTDARQTELAIVAIEQSLGRLSSCIMAASAYDLTPLDQLHEIEWRKMLDVTLTGTFLSCQAVLPRLRLRKFGRLILFGCVGCERIYHGTTAMPYRIAVSGNLALTKAYAQLSAQDGVTVNLIAPGYLENTIDMIDPQRLPAGRLTQCAEVLPAVRFLLSDEASAVSGTCLTVSGGYVT